MTNYKEVIKMKRCKICGKDKFAYHYFEGKLVPICDNCYNEHIAKHDRYELLMARLTEKRYMWILGMGKVSFPYTLFGLDVKLEDIIVFIVNHLGDNFTFDNQDQTTFKFDDYENPIIIERCLTFKNEETMEYIDINLRMGKYNFEDNTILFFTDKQAGLEQSNLNDYSSVIYNKDGIQRLEAYNFDNYNSYEIPEDDISKKEYLDDDDLRELVGLIN
jgi:hypothetical protein